MATFFVRGVGQTRKVGGAWYMYVDVDGKKSVYVRGKMSAAGRNEVKMNKAEECDKRKRERL